MARTDRVSGGHRPIFPDTIAVDDGTRGFKVGPKPTRQARRFLRVDSLPVSLCIPTPPRPLVAEFPSLNDSLDDLWVVTPLSDAARARQPRSGVGK